VASSSRNVYLSAAERRAAPALFLAMQEAARRVAAGEAIESCLEIARRSVGEAGSAIDYLEARQAETLARVARRREGPIRLLAAARLGATRRGLSTIWRCERDHSRHFDDDATVRARAQLR
jgi:pantoate--beta-alanine ligase